MKRARSSGFTLLELLVVVIVVGILATVALPRFGRMIRRARAAEASNIVGAILTAETVYYQEFTAFTNNLANLMIDLPADANSNFDYAVANTANNATATATGDNTGTADMTGVTVVGTVRDDGSRTTLVYGGL